MAREYAMSSERARTAAPRTERRSRTVNAGGGDVVAGCGAKLAGGVATGRASASAAVSVARGTALRSGGEGDWTATAARLDGAVRSTGSAAD